MKRSSTKDGQSMKTHWLRSTASPDHFIALCLSKAECKDALRSIAAPPRTKMKQVLGDAETHSTINAEGHTHSLICLGDGWHGMGSIQTASLLVSAAVHAWQQRCNNRGFNVTEDEARGIQRIAHGLFTEFVRRTQPA